MKKVRLQTIKPCNFFLPSPDEAFEFFFGSLSSRVKLKLLERKFKTGNLPSDRTLDNISKKGVKENTIKPFIEACIEKFPPEFKEHPDFKSENPVHVCDLGFWWNAAILGLNNGLEHSTLDISLLNEFMKKRCNDYKPQFEYMKASKQNIEFNKFIKLIIKSTLLTKKEQQDADDLFYRMDDKNENKNRDVEPSTEAAVQLLFNDFWLSIFAIIDNIILNDLAKNYSFSNTQELSCGVIGEIFSKNKKTFLGRFFSHLKGTTGKSYSELASFVVLPVSEYKRNGVNKKEVQIERFKEWRNGKSTPSISSLDAFFHSSFMGDHIMVYAILMRALDKKAKYISSYTVENYKRYYIYYKQKTML